MFIRASIHGLIGPNGAGKTTTFNVISGFYAPSSGKVTLSRRRTFRGKRTSALAELGLIRTFQGTTLFHQLSVLDNVRLGCHRSAKASLVRRILGRDRATEETADEKARGILEFFSLQDLAGRARLQPAPWSPARARHGRGAGRRPKAHAAR